MTDTAAPRYPYQDDQLSVDQRVDDLLARMSLADKAGLMFHALIFAGDVDTVNPMFPLLPPRTLITEYGLTHFNAFSSTPDGRSFAEWHNALQRVAAEHPLAIPVTLSTDPRHHFTDNPLTASMAGPFSQWPEPLGLAAIGSDEVVREFGDIARREYRAVGLRVALHPQIDLATEPRWSRISTTFGEDAELTSRLAAAYIRGFQTDVLGPDSVSTMTKHFPGGGPQKDGDDPHFAWGREQVYPGGNFEYHLGPFRAAIAAGTAQMMPYYGMPVGTDLEAVGFSFNRAIITELLRQELGFTGVICTDWGLISDHEGMGDVGVAKAWGVEHLDEDERLYRLVEAGVDQLGGEHCSDRLVRLVGSGRVSEARIEQSARRLLREKFVLGLFDRPMIDADRATSIVGCTEFREAGRRAQQKSVTLLTNRESPDGAPILPLRPGVKVYAESFESDELARRATIVDDPADADVAVIRLKTPWVPSGRGGMADTFHGGSLEFPPDEQARLAAICRSVPTVIDIYLERPAVLGRMATAAAAIVANYGIDEGALVDVLFGDAQPEGNLPFDLPSSMAAVVESRSDVAFDTTDPAFRFGDGLRYARST